MPQHHLGAVDRERRDDDHPTAARGVAHHARDHLVGIVVGVFGVAVGRLDHHGVDVPDRSGREQQRVSRPAEVAAEGDGRAARPEADLEPRRAQDVTGAVPGDVDALGDLERGVEADGHEQPEGGGGVGRGVQRAGRPVLGVPHPVGEGGLLLLEVRAVGQDDARQLRRARRAVDGAVESEVAEPGEEPAVVDVGVRQHDGVDGGGFHREGAPVREPEILATLEQAAVHQHARPRHVDQ